MSEESPICGRTRIKNCLHKERMIKCNTQRELWDLEDYEAIAPKIEHKPITKPEYRSLGVEPISPINNKKQISEVLVTSQFNKLKSTMKVNEGQKMTEFTRTSTPKNNNIYLECRIELSPIQNPVHSTLVQPSFSEHADISDKRNALKLNLNVRRNLAVHCSVTPFIIQQPIWRPHLLERVYKLMHTLH